MALISWFKHKSLWLQGGIIGILVCVLLAVFYITIYNAFFIQFFPEGQLPMYSLLLPIATGHFFVFAAHFVAEGYMVPLLGCVSEDCFARAEWVTFVGTGIILLLLYFGVGSLIGWFVEKRKKNVTSSSPLSP